MLGNDYQELAMRTNDGNSTRRLMNTMNHKTGGILNAALGLSGEVGEFNDMLKKWIFHEKPLDEEHLKKELGDVMWYVAMMAESFGWNLDEIMQMNIDKLKARYPEGFSVEKSNNRKSDDV